MFIFDSTLMKRISFTILFLFCLLVSTKLGATHLVGGFISYEYMSSSSGGTRYMVTVTVYRDCKQGSINLADDIDLCIYRRDNNAYVRTEKFAISTREFVKPPGRTDCPEVANACLERGIYRHPVTLPTNSFGYFIQYQVCCRNTQVNLMNSSSGKPDLGQMYQVIIPPTNVKNSSPYFTEVPVPFMCVNDTTDINNYAIDEDGDSLVYKFTTPWDGALSSCAGAYTPPVAITRYTNGFSSTNPFGAGGITKINSRNGVTTYLSKLTGNFATALDVYEYRYIIDKWVLLGITRLDLQVLVIKCNSNNRPIIKSSADSFTIYGGQRLCFTVSAYDKDKNGINLSGKGDILTGANGFIGNKATFPDAFANSTVSSEFCWQTECTQARNDPYLFTAYAIDDGCPSKYSLFNFSIRVKPFTGKVTIAGPSPICQGSKDNIYTITPTANTAPELIGIVYNVTITNGILQNKTGNKLTVSWDKNATSGSITVVPVSQFGCPGTPFTYPVTLIVSPPLPVIPSVDTLCPNTTKFYTTATTSGYKYQWWAFNGLINGTSSANSVSITWLAPGKANAKLVQYNTNNCPSDTATINVWVSKPSTPPIAGPITICPNSNRIEYKVSTFQAGSSFQWYVTGGTIVSVGAGSVKINWGGAGIGQVKVIEKNRFGCLGDTVYLAVDKTYKLIGANIIGDTSICEFTKNVIYTVPLINNTTYNWSITGGTITSGQLTHQITVDWGVSATGSLTVYESSFDSVNSIPCISDPTSRIINIRLFPIANKINGDFEVCQNPSSGNFNVNGYAKSSYLWSINSDTNNIVGQSTNAILYSYLQFGNFKVRVIETTEYGCVGKPIDTLLLIHPKPTTTPIIGDSIICYPNINSFLYSVTGLPNSKYNWTIDGGTPVPLSTNNSINIIWTGQQYNSLKVVETSEFGCVGDTLRLNIFFDNPSLYLKYLTVNPPPAADNGIDLFWELRNAPKYNNSLFLERREASTSNPFVTVGTIAGTQLQYNNGNISADFNAWDYRVKGFDLCGQPLYTQVHTNILLSGKKVSAYDITMNFTPYIGWGNASIRYDVYRLLKNAATYELYEPNVTTFNMAYGNGLEYYTQCYRIKATKIGTDTVTWSNEVCFDFEPLLFIPNAFSPNGDEFNNTFIMRGGALKSVEISIYNRWGEKLYTGNSLNAQWDGTYKGKDQPQDVYIYNCLYYGYDGRKYSTKGTITLLR